MEQMLERLFESTPKVRVLRLFMQNAEKFFTMPDIIIRSRIRGARVRREVAQFIKLGLIRKKTAWIRHEIKRRSKKRGTLPLVKIKTKKEIVYCVNPSFPHLAELRDLVTKFSVASRPKLLRQIKALGNVKLAILCGIFIHHTNARTDMLLVGDKIKIKKLEQFLSQIESDLGRSIQYTFMNTDEFKYRTNMYDRFIRDVLEYPHEKLINKLHI